MQTSHSLKTSINLTNKINSPSTSGMAENVVIPSGSVKIRQGSKFCDMKFSRKLQRFLPIMASSDGSTNKIPSGAIPNRFSYENQLKIMLENQKNYKRINAKISFTIYRKKQINFPDDIYSFFALRAAIKKIKTLKSKNQNEAEYVLQIVTAMRDSIKEINSYANKTASTAIVNEQLRFIGLVLGHLLFRENPIFNVANNEFSFTARIEPDIDAVNLSACGMLVIQFDEELKAQLNGENLLREDSLNLASRKNGSTKTNSSVQGFVKRVR
uniref:Uncharacterized protein n=1 Tax=Globodera rostochiensis TaxID=31243 RepID=A0A914IFP0_GLORO